jgi:uncharacterized protein YjbI with pentapeptide repeats
MLWKDVREWLNILGVLLIPLLIGVYTVVSNTQQTTLAQQQHDSDQRIAQQSRQADAANQLDQQREAALKTYEDDLSTLLLDRHLHDSQPGDEVRIVALDKTLQVLHRLDGPRNARAIQFLQDAQLIGVNPTTGKSHNIIDFSDADLHGDDLSEVNLIGVALFWANLSGVDLYGASLDGASLRGANLRGANLRVAHLSFVDLSGADLSGADLSGADLPRASLDGTSLRGANLSRVDFSDADLSGADLSGADLSGANLSEVNLDRADLSFAELIGATVLDIQLAETASLQGTILPDGSTHP